MTDDTERLRLIAERRATVVERAYWKERLEDAHDHLRATRQRLREIDIALGERSE